jgi:hypothetical protein
MYYRLHIKRLWYCWEKNLQILTTKISFGLPGLWTIGLSEYWAFGLSDYWACTDMYEYLEDLSLCSDDTLEDNSASLCVKQDFLKYLLSLKDIEVVFNANFSNISAILWRFIYTCTYKLQISLNKPKLSMCFWHACIQ